MRNFRRNLMFLVFEIILIVGLGQGVWAGHKSAPVVSPTINEQGTDIPVTDSQATPVPVFSLTPLEVTINTEYDSVRKITNAQPETTVIQYIKSLDSSKVGSSEIGKTDINGSFVLNRREKIIRQDSGYQIWVVIGEKKSNTVELKVRMETDKALVVTAPVVLVAPIVTSIKSKSYPEGTINVNGSIDLRGRGLKGSLTIMIGNSKVSVESRSNTSVKFPSPILPAGESFLTVTNGDQTSIRYFVNIVVPEVITKYSVTPTKVVAGTDYDFRGEISGTPSSNIHYFLQYPDEKYKYENLNIGSTDVSGKYSDIRKETLDLFDGQKSGIYKTWVVLGGVKSNVVNIKVTAKKVATPTITSVQSSSYPEGTINTKGLIDIIGTGLKGDLIIMIGDFKVLAKSESETSVQFLSPEMPAGESFLTVTNNAKTSKKYLVKIVVPDAQDEISSIDQSENLAAIAISLAKILESLKEFIVGLR